MQSLFGLKPKAPARPADDLVRDSSIETFVEDVIEASQQTPVIVDFWAPWCGPCKQLGPALEKLVRAAKGAVRMVKINVDENPELAAQMRVQSIPAVYAFFGGRPIDGFVGAQPDSQLKQWVAKLAEASGAPQAPTGIPEALAHAKTALTAGDLATAVTYFGAVLQRDPANADAIAGMGKCLLAEGNIDRARDLLAKLPPDAAKSADIQGLKAALEIADQAAALRPLSALQAVLAADIDDHQARIDLAVRLFALGDAAGAIDALLDSIRRDRAWNEEAARKQLLKLFEALGHTHPTTVQGRRKLSTLLFS